MQQSQSSLNQSRIVQPTTKLKFQRAATQVKQKGQSSPFDYVFEQNDTRYDQNDTQMDIIIREVDKIAAQCKAMQPPQQRPRVNLPRINPPPTKRSIPRSSSTKIMRRNPYAQRPPRSNTRLPRIKSDPNILYSQKMTPFRQRRQRKFQNITPMKVQQRRTNSVFKQRQDTSNVSHLNRSRTTRSTNKSRLYRSVIHHNESLEQSNRSINMSIIKSNKRIANRVGELIKNLKPTREQKERLIQNVLNHSIRYMVTTRYETVDY